MQARIPEIVVERNQKAIIGPYFRHSVGGLDIKEKTIVELSVDNNYLEVRFSCLDDPFVNENHYFDDNSGMWNQEVFEVFIANGKEDPKNYLEIEINPNNALFIAEIHNPDQLGLSLSLDFIDPLKSGIVHEVNKESRSWGGYLLLPLSLVQYPGPEKGDQFRVNFYRTILQKKQNSKSWKCSAENSIFACWNSTMADEPNFHRSECFGYLKLL
jgi:hypothetical protein